MKRAKASRRRAAKPSKKPTQQQHQQRVDVVTLFPLARLLVRAERQLWTTMTELTHSTKEGVACHLTTLASTLWSMRQHLRNTSAEKELRTVAESERAADG